MEVGGPQPLQTEFNQALNEQHYGALQGLNKEETAKKYGKEQVHIWRRSYDVTRRKTKRELNPEGISESLKDMPPGHCRIGKKKFFRKSLKGKTLLSRRTETACVQSSCISTI